MDPVHKYLARYAEPQVNAYDVSRSYRHALVIPAYHESASAIGSLLEVVKDNDALLIVVVNVPSNASREQVEATSTLLKSCAEQPAEHLLTINCVSNPLPRRQGVGLARKIGCDIALNLHVQGRIDSPWIYTTDADAVLPNNYFTHPLGKEGAHVFAHRHVSLEPTLESAVHLYDRHMAYYVAGLEYAGSQYAYPTLGSTIAVHSNTYAQIRGFPKRNAAEDFYLLNKTAKVAKVRFTPEVCITIEARLSKRVPFGTGPALAKIIEAKIIENESSYLSYSFRAFQALKTTINALDKFADTGSLEINPDLRDILASLGWEARAPKFVQGYKPAQRKKVVHDWFDALKTLQFMHHIAEYLPNEPLLETMQTLPKPVVETINRHLPREPRHK